jgi:hypothetical protein
MMQEQGKLTEKARLVSWARAMQTELKVPPPPLKGLHPSFWIRFLNLFPLRQAIAEYAGDGNESSEGESPQPLVDVPKRGEPVSNNPVVPAVGGAPAAGAAASPAAIGAPAKVVSPNKVPGEAKKATTASGGGAAGSEGWGEGTSDVDGIQSYEVVQVFTTVEICDLLSVSMMLSRSLDVQGEAIL